jgi:hypothetical protein
VIAQTVTTNASNICRSGKVEKIGKSVGFPTGLPVLISTLTTLRYRRSGVLPSPYLGRSFVGSGLVPHLIFDLLLIVFAKPVLPSPEKAESWLRKTGQNDKWIFRLTAARMAAHQERS